MRKILVMIIGICCLVFFVGCESKEEKVSIEQGIQLLNEDKYEEALAKFQEGLKVNSKNEKLVQLKDMTELYIKAKLSYDSHNFVEAKLGYLDYIQDSYKDYSLKEEIDTLKVKSQNMLDKQAALTGAIEKLALVNVKDYTNRIGNDNKYISWVTAGEPMDITHMAVTVDTSKYPYNATVLLGWTKDLTEVDNALKKVFEVLGVDKENKIYEALVNGVLTQQNNDIKFKSGSNEVSIKVAQSGMIADINIYAE